VCPTKKWVLPEQDLCLDHTPMKSSSWHHVTN
jgi:hypothetical protein